MGDDDLGNVRSEHRGRSLELFGVAALLEIVGGLGALAARELWLVALGVAASLVWLVIAQRWTPRHVLLCDHGLEVHWYLRRPSRMCFDECRYVLREWSLHTGKTMQTTVSDYVLVLVDDAGRRLRLRPRSIEDAEHLFTRIERLVVYPHERERREAFERGENVSFGEKILVNDEALILDGERSEWSDVREVELSPALLIVHFRGRRRRTLRVSRIPFLWGLVAILRAKGIRPKLFEGFREP